MYQSTRPKIGMFIGLERASGLIRSERRRSQMTNTSRMNARFVLPNTVPFGYGSRNTSTLIAATMLRRHATPNTSSAATTGMTRLFGVQYWMPSRTPTIAVTTRLTARPIGSSRHGLRGSATGAFRNPICEPPRSMRGRSSRRLRHRQRQQPGRGRESLGDLHAARDVGERVERDAAGRELRAFGGRNRAGERRGQRTLREEIIQHGDQVPRGDAEVPRPPRPPRDERLRHLLHPPPLGEVAEQRPAPRLAHPRPRAA